MRRKRSVHDEQIEWEKMLPRQAVTVGSSKYSGVLIWKNIAVKLQKKLGKIAIIGLMKSIQLLMQRLFQPPKNVVLDGRDDGQCIPPGERKST